MEMENEKNQNNEFNDPVPNLNQQDKIIAAINKNDLSYLGHLYVDVEPDERADFIDAMSRGEVTDVDFTKVLRKIASPMDRALKSDDKMDEVFNGVTSDCISGNRQMMGVVAYFVRHNMSKRNEVNQDDIKEFYSMYPDPIVLKEPVDSFINQLSAVNNDKKVDEYKSSIDRLEKTLYGKRYEYAKQIELLKNESDNKKLGRIGLELTKESNL